MNSLGRFFFTLLNSVFITMVLAAMVFILSTLISNAVANDVVVPKEVSMSYRDYFPGGHDPLVTQNGLPNREIGQEINLTLNTTILAYLYWDNRIHADTDKHIPSGSSQFRTVGWEFRFGMQLSDYWQFGYYHHSQHLLDTEYAHGHFPVRDAVELKFILYKDNKRDSIF